MHSNDIRHLYDETYFLGGISKYNGQEIGVGGIQEFKEGEISADRVVFINQVDFKDKNILDVGFGRGEILKYCYDNGAKSCVGIDYSPAAFEIASNYLKETDVKLYFLAVDELIEVEENDFEIIYMRSVIEHIPDTEWEIFLKVARWKFNKNCILFALTPAKKRGDYLQMHNNYQTHANLIALFENYFETVQIQKIKNTFWICCKRLKRK